MGFFLFDVSSGTILGGTSLISIRPNICANSKPRGVDWSLRQIGVDMNGLFAMPAGFCPARVLAFTQQNHEALRQAHHSACSIEDRGLIAAWRRFSLMIETLSPGLHASPTPPRTLTDLWMPEILDRIDGDIQVFLDRHPSYLDLIDREAAHWLNRPATGGQTDRPQMTLDALRSLVMHTHAQHLFFELHSFVQRAGQSGLSALANWFAPQLSGLHSAIHVLDGHGFGAPRVVRKALKDSDETTALIARLQQQGSIHLPLGSWGDTTYNFIEKDGYSHVLEIGAYAVNVTPFGRAFMRDPTPSYREYLVKAHCFQLVRVYEDHVSTGTRSGFGKHFDVFQLDMLPGGQPRH